MIAQADHDLLLRIVEAANADEHLAAILERRRPDFPSQSEYDLALAGALASKGFSAGDQERAIYLQRRMHGQNPEKGLRADYTERTVAAASSNRGRSGLHIAERPIPPLGFVAAMTLVATHKELRRPIIFGLLRLGEILNLISHPKSKKSWLVAALALALATGKDFLGLKVAAVSVLIADNELHDETISCRLRDQATDLKIDLNALGEKLCVDVLRGKHLDLYDIEKYFMQLPPGKFQVIILDAFYKFIPDGVDENSNSAMAGLYALLDKMAARLGASIIVVHHTTKGNQAGKRPTDIGAGAGAMGRAADAHVVLLPHELPNVAVFDAVVRSWPPLNPFCIEWRHPQWHRVDADPLRVDGAKKEKEAPLTLLKFAETCFCETPEIRDVIIDRAMAAGATKTLANSLLRRAVAAGQVAKHSCGSNVPARFSRPKVQNDLNDIF